MRRLLFVVALMVAATFSIYAQKPWVEHDLRQQQRVLTNPDIPHIVKGTLSHLEDITECECEGKTDSRLGVQETRTQH